jgi:hypothetical protein
VSRRGGWIRRCRTCAGTAEVVIDGPETGIEEVMGGGGQSQAVVRAIRVSLGWAWMCAASRDT